MEAFAFTGLFVDARFSQRGYPVNAWLSVLASLCLRALYRSSETTVSSAPRMTEIKAFRAA